MVIIWSGGGSFEIGRPKSRGWKNFGRRWTSAGEGVRIGQFSWTSYVCVIPNDIFN